MAKEGRLKGSTRQSPGVNWERKSSFNERKGTGRCELKEDQRNHTTEEEVIAGR